MIRGLWFREKKNDTGLAFSIKAVEPEVGGKKEFGAGGLQKRFPEGNAHASREIFSSDDGRTHWAALS